MANRFSQIDQENVDILLQDLEGEHFFRPCASVDINDIKLQSQSSTDDITLEEELDDENTVHNLPAEMNKEDKLLFVYQVWIIIALQTNCVNL